MHSQKVAFTQNVFVTKVHYTYLLTRNVNGPLNCFFNAHHTVLTQHTHTHTHTHTHVHRSTEYVAFCVSGYRSAIATSILRKAGFTVRDVYGGFAAVSVFASSHTTSGKVSASIEACFPILYTVWGMCSYSLSSFFRTRRERGSSSID